MSEWTKNMKEWITVNICQSVTMWILGLLLVVSTIVVLVGAISGEGYVAIISGQAMLALIKRAATQAITKKKAG